MKRHAPSAAAVLLSFAAVFLGLRIQPTAHAGGLGNGGLAGVSAGGAFGSAITSSVASGSNAITLTTGQRIEGGNGYWVMDAIAGGRWITLGDLYVGETITAGGSFIAQDTIDLGNYLVNTSGTSPVQVYDTQGMCLGNGAGGVTDCDGKIAHGLDVSTVQAITVADTGDGSAAASTLTPTAAYVSYTCSDTDGCTITLSETGAVDGSTVKVTNVSANASTFADTSGLTELAGSFAMGQYDSLTLVYATDRWVEVHRSNN